MNLEETAAALATQFPGGRAAEIDRAEQRLEKFGRIAFGGLGVVIAVGILILIYFIITKMILPGTQVLPGIGAILFLIFAALSLTYVVFQEDLKEKRAALRKPRSDSAGASPAVLEVDTNKLLNQPPAGSVASVIEDTTDLLPVKNKARKL